MEYCSSLLKRGRSVDLVVDRLPSCCLFPADLLRGWQLHELPRLYICALRLISPFL